MSNSKAIRILLVSILIVSIAVVGLLIFIVFSGNGENTIGVGNKGGESFRGGESFDECGNYTQEKNIVFCEIMASYDEKNISYCETNFNNSLEYRYGRNESIPLLSAKDFCWRMLASANNSLCSNIEDEGARQRCYIETARR